jgi:uncharacterized delta-60 repeat protein
MKHLLLLVAFCTFTLTTAHAQPGTLDFSFDPGTSVETPGAVEAITIQPDGKLFAVGGFLTFDGNPSKNIVRINTDGSYDESFQVGAGFTGSSDVAGATGRCYAVTMQPDGMVLVGGIFNSYNDTTVRSIARLRPDGSLDTTFVTGNGFNNIVHDIRVLPDGRILCVGQFTQFNGINRSKAAILLPDGSLDFSFVPPAMDVNAFTAAVQGDGKLLIGGTISTVGGAPAGRLVRLNADGTLDSSFPQGTGFNALVLALHIMDDGRIMVGGGFTEFDGLPKQRITRLMPDGSLDPSFNASASASDQVRGIVEDAQGRFIITGNFFQVNGVARGRVARLLANGTLDTSFDTPYGVGNTIMDVLLQPDGQLVVGGYFTTVELVARRSIARLNTTGSTAIAEEPGLEFELFPNPTNGLVMLRGDLQGKVEVRVLDAAGRVVEERVVQAVRGSIAAMPLDHLMAGTYVVHIRSEQASATRVLIRE